MTEQVWLRGMLVSESSFPAWFYRADLCLSPSGAYLPWSGLGNVAAVVWRGFFDPDDVVLSITVPSHSQHVEYVQGFPLLRGNLAMLMPTLLCQ